MAPQGKGLGGQGPGWARESLWRTQRVWWAPLGARRLGHGPLISESPTPTTCPVPIRMSQHWYSTHACWSPLEAENSAPMQCEAPGRSQRPGKGLQSSNRDLLMRSPEKQRSFPHHFCFVESLSEGLIYLMLCSWIYWVGMEKDTGIEAKAGTCNQNDCNNSCQLSGFMSLHRQGQTSSSI